MALSFAHIKMNNTINTFSKLKRKMQTQKPRKKVKWSTLRQVNIQKRAFSVDEELSEKNYSEWNADKHIWQHLNHYKIMVIFYQNWCSRGQ